MMTTTTEQEQRQGPRSIVCDADEVSARVMARALREEGFEVTTCRSAQACEALLAEDDVCLVVTAVLLPDLDGLALVRRLRAGHRTFGLLVVSVLQAETRAREAGADGFLLKPVSRENFIRAAQASCRREADVA